MASDFIIGGTDPGIFEPNSTLTREQMAIMVARVMKTCGVDLTEKAKKNPFNDTAQLFASSNKYIDQLYGIGILAGYQDGGYHPFREMTVQEAQSFVSSGMLGGGMLPKLQNCINAITSGVSRVHILDGRIPHCLLLEIFTDRGIGTAIFNSEEDERYYHG